MYYGSILHFSSVYFIRCIRVLKLTEIKGVYIATQMN